MDAAYLPKYSHFDLVSGIKALMMNSYIFLGICYIGSLAKIYAVVTGAGTSQLMFVSYMLNLQYVFDWLWLSLPGKPLLGH